MRHVLAVGLVLLSCACLPASAGAAQKVKLHASLTPERLGAGTTIAFAFTVSTTTGRVPSPLTGVELLYPANLGLATSGLGLATCTAAILEALGPEGCPSESLMGYGTALVEIPFGPLILQETTQTTIFMAPLRHGRLGLLFDATGNSPVSAEIVFPGLVLPAYGPFGGDLSTTIPLVPTLPGAPNAAVVKLNSTIGPLGLTYYEHLHRRRVGYHPKGILLPNNCPHGGFPFAATLTFLDGTHSSAHTTVPCPAKRKGNPLSRRRA